MTPYAKAQAILAELVEAALPLEPDFVLPTLRYAQIGAPVVACESLIVAVAGMTADNGLEVEDLTFCDSSQIGTFTIVHAIDCAWVANEDGTDDPARVAEASARMDANGTFLWNYANELVPFVSKQWTIGWAFMGGLGLTTLTLTTGID